MKFSIGYNCADSFSYLTIAIIRATMQAYMHKLVLTVCSLNGLASIGAGVVGIKLMVTRLAPSNDLVLSGGRVIAQWVGLVIINLHSLLIRILFDGSQPEWRQFFSFITVDSAF